MQWKFAQDRTTSALLQSISNEDGASTWVKPQTDIIKVTVDTTIFEDRGEYGFGMVARDSKGELVQARTSLQGGHVTPKLAEAMAVKEALSWIKNMDWPKVELESDCLVVVQIIRSKVVMRSPFGMVIEDCRRLTQNLNKVALYFIRRSANMVVHHFARATYTYPDRVFDRSSVPIELIRCIEEDTSI